METRKLTGLEVTHDEAQEIIGSLAETVFIVYTACSVLEEHLAHGNMQEAQEILLMMRKSIPALVNTSFRENGAPFTVEMYNQIEGRVRALSGEAAAKMKAKMQTAQMHAAGAGKWMH